MDQVNESDLIDQLYRALQRMVDRWEPDTAGQDRIMWENAVEACQAVREFRSK